VLDLHDTVLANSPLFAHMDHISFLDLLPSSDCLKFDIIYFGASLGYFEDYSALLKKYPSILLNILLLQTVQ